MFLEMQVIIPPSQSSFHFWRTLIQMLNQLLLSSISFLSFSPIYYSYSYIINSKKKKKKKKIAWKINFLSPKSKKLSHTCWKEVFAKLKMLLFPLLIHYNKDSARRYKKTIFFFHHSLFQSPFLILIILEFHCFLNFWKIIRISSKSFWNLEWKRRWRTPISKWIHF